MGSSVVPMTARSARIWPVIGPRQKPCPLKPAAMMSPSTSSDRSMTGNASGVRSSKPPHTWATRKILNRGQDIWCELDRFPHLLQGRLHAV